MNRLFACLLSFAIAAPALAQPLMVDAGGVTPVPVPKDACTKQVKPKPDTTQNCKPGSDCKTSSGGFLPQRMPPLV